jgi:hypothetical protein
MNHARQNTLSVPLSPVIAPDHLNRGLGGHFEDGANFWRAVSRSMPASLPAKRPLGPKDGLQVALLDALIDDVANLLRGERLGK